MKNTLTKILKVKSIITLVLTALFVYLCINGEISSEQFMTIFTTTVFSLFRHSDENKEDKK